MSSRELPTEKVRCPVHGFIHYSPNERRIIDQPVFQRLRHIRQLAMTYLVYPGAMHSRFEHSLGVMELATQAFDRLCVRHKEVLAAEFGKIPEFHEAPIPRARQAVRMLALLHDVGHPAFSHAAESTIPGGKHEDVSVFAIREVLRGELDAIFFPGLADVLCRMMTADFGVPLLREFVAGQMDMDRTDYLRRDSLHCGVDYGVFDSRRLIECLTVIENPDTGRLQLALERGGEHAFEALVLARFQMHTQVYLHRLRRIYDHYLTEYMKLWGPEHHRTMGDVLRFDDGSVYEDIRRDASIEGERRRWAARIVERRHHRVVMESGDGADHATLRRYERVLRALRQEFKDVDFHLDDCSNKIHSLAVPGDQDGDKTEDLYVIQKNGKPVRLGEDSAILGKIPRRVRTVRIFGDAADKRLCEARARARSRYDEET